MPNQGPSELTAVRPLPTATVNSNFDPATPRFIPSDRSGARGLLSGTERNVYLVGGRRSDGTLVGEVWRYGLASGEWRPIFTDGLTSSPSGPDRALPADVRAVAYHDISGVMLVIDELKWEAEEEGPIEPMVTTGTSTKGGGAAKTIGPKGRETFVRLLVLNTHTGSARVAIRMPRADVLGLAPAFEDRDVPASGGGAFPASAVGYGAVALEDGSFVIVVRRPSRHAWTAYRLTVNPSGAITWHGRLAGTGVVLDDPVNTTGGLLLPVERAGEHFLDVLEPRAFKP